MPTLTPAHPGPWRTLAVVPDLDGGQGSWCQIAVAGTFTDPRYGEWTFDRAFFDALVANFNRLALQVPVDLDHSAMVRGDTRAAGWHQQLQVRGDREPVELWAYVQWTSLGMDSIRGGEYRFYSVEYSDDYVDHHGTHHGPTLIAGALTNRPFLTGMQQITLSAADASATLPPEPTLGGRTLYVTGPGARYQEDSKVDVKLLAQALGKSEDTPEAQLLAAVQALRTQAAQAPPEGAIVLTAEAHKALTDAADEGAAATKRAQDTERDLVLDAAVKEGRLAPVALDAHKALWDAAPEAAKAAVAALPVTLKVAAKGSTAAPVLPGASADDPTAPPADAERSMRLEHQARALMQAAPTLSYRDALMQADKLVPEDRPFAVASTPAA
jgi:phage I-like protein